MKWSSGFFLICVWIISAALIYIGMDVAGSAYPLFGLVVPAFVSLDVTGKEG